MDPSNPFNDLLADLEKADKEIYAQLTEDVNTLDVTGVDGKVPNPDAAVGKSEEPSASNTASKFGTDIHDLLEYDEDTPPPSPMRPDYKEEEHDSTCNGDDIAWASGSVDNVVAVVSRPSIEGHPSDGSPKKAPTTGQKVTEVNPTKDDVFTHIAWMIGKRSADLSERYYASVLFSALQVPSNYMLNHAKVALDKNDKAYEIYLRPDVAQEAIMSLIGAVALTVGGQVASASPSVAHKSQAILPHIAVKTNLNEGSGQPLDAFCYVYIGVNADMMRVVLIQITTNNSDPVANNGSQRMKSPASASLLQNISGRWMVALTQYAETCVSQFADALHTESLSVACVCSTLSRRWEMQGDRETVNCGSDSNNQTMTNRVSGPRTQSASSESKVASLSLKGSVESILDPEFVEDLQAVMSQHLVSALTPPALAMDSKARSMEHACARLMTILKPIYQRADLTMPNPPPSRPITDYPLVIEHHSMYGNEANRPMLSDTSKETSRLLILRARKQMREKSNTLTSTAMCSSDKDSMAMDISEFDTHPLDVKIYSKVHTQLLLSSKTNVMYGQVCNINAARRGVQSQLQSWAQAEGKGRYNRKSTATLDRIQSIEAFKSILIRTLHTREMKSIADKSNAASLTAKCRVITEKEPVILETNAALDGRSGTLYITYEHLCFHSAGSVRSALGVFGIGATSTTGEILKLIPLPTIRPPVRSAATVAFVSGGLSIEDVSGQLTILEVSGPTADHSTRVCDLINLLLKEKNIEFSESAAAPQPLTDTPDLLEKIPTVKSKPPNDTQENVSSVAFGPAMGSAQTDKVPTQSLLVLDDEDAMSTPDKRYNAEYESANTDGAVAQATGSLLEFDEEDSADASLLQDGDRVRPAISSPPNGNGSETNLTAEVEYTETLLDLTSPMDPSVNEVNVADKGIKEAAPAPAATAAAASNNKADISSTAHDMSGESEGVTQNALKSPNAYLAPSTASESVSTSSDAKSKVGKKKSLGKNIHAFLAQSQSQSAAKTTQK